MREVVLVGSCLREKWVADKWISRCEERKLNVLCSGDPKWRSCAGIYKLGSRVLAGSCFAMDSVVGVNALSVCVSAGRGWW